MEEIELNVPAGVTEEYALQFKGKGNQYGRSFGDLVIRLSVKALRVHYDSLIRKF